MQEEYTLAELARLLHKTEKEVLRDMEKGLLEGRKTRDQWIFSLKNVVNYITNNIIDVHVADKELRDLIARTAEHARQEQAFFLKDLLSYDLAQVPLIARSSEAVIRDMTQNAANSGRLWDLDRMRDAIREREQLCSTAMPNGVAILHSRYRMPGNISESFVALAVLPAPIAFGGGFNRLTDIFFFVCCSDDSIHLRALAKLARIMGRPGFLDALRETTSGAEAVDLIARTESELIDETEQKQA
ncbi:MAG: PTS sugar transporter subunit IIA [Planctomycetia bacterium]|nr:PTS sugar transporter subunit IIA [Planctomycetia bacterium]